MQRLEAEGARSHAAFGDLILSSRTQERVYLGGDTDAGIVSLGHAAFFGIGAYVVAEFAPGRTLGELLRGGPLSAIEAAFVARELGDALVGVHAQGLLEVVG